jgi:hypothetical protein
MCAEDTLDGTGVGVGVGVDVGVNAGLCVDGVVSVWVSMSVWIQC